MMFWQKKESKIIKELTESVICLEKKFMSLEVKVDDLKIRYKKRMFPKLEKVDKKTKDIYNEQLLPME